MWELFGTGIDDLRGGKVRTCLSMMGANQVLHQVFAVFVE